MLSKESIKKYQQIYKEKFGKEISEAEAEKQGSKLINFFKLLIEMEQKQKEREK